MAGRQGLWLHNTSAGLCAARVLIKALAEIQDIAARLPDTESHPRSAPRTLSLPPDYERSLTWMPFLLARGASAAALRRRRRVRRRRARRVLGRSPAGVRRAARELQGQGHRRSCPRGAQGRYRQGTYCVMLSTHLLAAVLGICATRSCVMQGESGFWMAEHNSPRPFP